MAPAEIELLEAFRGWLAELPADSALLCETLEGENAPEPLRRCSADVLWHLRRSLALIPDGLEALGYLEHAFVSRALARELSSAHDLAERGGVLRRLAQEAELVERFLPEEFSRLSAAARGWPQGDEHPGAELLVDAERRAEALAEVRAWIDDYRPPLLEQRPEELLKLGAFMRTRLSREASSNEPAAEASAPEAAAAAPENLAGD